MFSNPLFRRQTPLEDTVPSIRIAPLKICCRAGAFALAFPLLVLPLIPATALYAAGRATPALPAAFFQAAVPATGKQIYSPTADAKADIAAAMVTAKKYHRNIILDFGGNWCGDCQVLDIYMHQSPNAQLIAENFVVVHVDIGRYDKNVDVAEKYGIPLKKGVPALAVLDPNGKVLLKQQTGEFENMRQMNPASVTEFLNKWKPTKRV